MRFAEATLPEAEFKRLLQQFTERFSAPPPGNTEDHIGGAGKTYHLELPEPGY